MKQRTMKFFFTLLLLVVLVMVGVEYFLNPHYVKQASNIFRGFLFHSAEVGTENYKLNYTPMDLKRNLSKQNVSHSKIETVTREKTLGISKCGYDSCPTGKPGFLNVHLVPHSHQDLGWLNTMDQYYNGEGKIIGVVHVINRIIEGLKDHPHRKFNILEIAFFHRWWISQNETVRNVVMNLVAKGQLEFISGGWCMSDEATTHYVDIIDQMSLGSNFLNDTFGECSHPKVGWQIDTFGHSKEHANLLAQMGFDGMFLWRLHEEEYKQRKESKSLNFVWTTNHNFGIDGKLFTGILLNGYDPPPFLCAKKDYFNVKWVDLFLDYLQDYTRVHRTTDILIPMGTDFRIREDFTCFFPTDKLIEYTNKLQDTGSKVNLFYSSPSCYLKALNSHHNITWPSKKDDMFPYVTYGSFLDGSPEDQEYWVGLYTSRPAFKHMIRVGSNLLQSCKQWASFLSMNSVEHVGDISVMKHAMAVMQHHDAITGTSKQFVIDDYIRILYRGFEECFKIQNSFYQKELPKANKTLSQLSYCSLNMSQCDVTEKSEKFVVNVYNSLASVTNKYVRVPVANRAYQVLDPAGNVIPCDVIPIPEFVKILPGRNSSATHELVFLAFQLPPLGSKSYYVEVNTSNDASLKNSKTNQMFIENEHIIVRLNEKIGLIESISVNGNMIELEQEILWYDAREPQMKNYSSLLMRRASGIHHFRSNHTNPFHLRNAKGVSVSIYKGKLVQEIHQKYNNWVGQVIRLYKGHEHVELDWVVGPIDLDDKVGKEIVNRITTKLSSKKEFFTDSNGRQMIKRKVGFHGDSLKINITDNVAANYYPVNSQIYLKDEAADKQLTVLVDRAQGGSSLNDGQIELLIHRRHVYEEMVDILNETAFGVGLAVRGTHLLVLSRIAESFKVTRPLSQQIFKQPHISFIPSKFSFQQWSKNYKMETKILNGAFPWNVNLLTFEHRTDEKYLIRLEHPYDAGEDAELSKPVVVNFNQSFFNGFSIESVEETMLGAIKLKKDSKRFIWKESNETNRQEVNIRVNNTAFDSNMTHIILYPMQIRTFILTLKKNT